MQDSTFTPKGPTYLISNTGAQQLKGTNPNEQCTSVLIRCLATGYFTWTTGNLAQTAPPTITVTAPTVATPSVNTIGMTVGGVQTLMLPNLCWVASSVASGFEMTPGEGV